MGTLHQEKLPQRQMETNLSSTRFNGPATGAASCTWPPMAIPQCAEERQESAQRPTALPPAEAIATALLMGWLCLLFSWAVPQNF